MPILKLTWIGGTSNPLNQISWTASIQSGRKIGIRYSTERYAYVEGIEVREEIVVESGKEVVERGREIEAVVRMAEVVPKKQRDGAR